MCLHKKHNAAAFTAAIVLTLFVFLLCGCDNINKVPDGINHIPYKVIEEFNNDEVIGILNVSQVNQNENIFLQEGYVLNTSSKKIHLPNCPGVKKIAEKNYAVCEDYQTATAKGYKPCGTCMKK